MVNTPPPSGAPRKKCAVYVDGFNAYYGVFKHHPEFKWLNMVSYFEEILDPCEVEMVNYFTAMIEGDSASSTAKLQRQTIYITALRSFKKLKLVWGKFQPKDATCHHCSKNYKFPQEKKTDVNIAMAMTIDAMARNFEVMVLISGDSDLHPVCQWIKLNRPEIRLMVYIPAIAREQQYRRADALTEIGVRWAFLPIAEMAAHQLPDPIVLKFGSFPKPASWV